MGTFRRHTAYALAAAAFLLPVVAAAGASSEVNLASDGTLSAKRVVVIQKAGSNLFTRATWSQAFVRLTVLVNASTVIMKNHGETMTVADLKEGDLLDIEGTLASGADTLIVNPTSIRDISLERESKTLSGAIANIDRSALSFTLSNKTFGDTTVIMSASTAITKGARSIAFADFKVGDRVLSASGMYDYPTNALAASDISIYQDQSIFTPRNFQGALKSISGTTLPASMVVTVGNTDYTVYLSAQASVLKNNKTAASLVRYVVGDKVRFYGSIRQTNLSEIDASIVRDLEF